MRNVLVLCCDVFFFIFWSVNHAPVGSLNTDEMKTNIEYCSAIPHNLWVFTVISENSLNSSNCLRARQEKKKNEKCR